MKKSFLLLCSICMSSIFFADGLTATLQQGDEMTPFYGVNAFKEAYQAADSGAIITLSVGNFNSPATIEKSLTIIGASAMQSDNQYNTNLPNITIVADNVTIEGVNFSNLVNLGNIRNCHIKRSYLTILGSLNDSSYHTNTIVEQSYVVSEYAIARGINYCICNSFIGGFCARNTGKNMAYIINCFITNFNASDKYQPYAIYRKNIIQFIRQSGSYYTDYRINLYSPSEYYDNAFLTIRFYYSGSYHYHSYSETSGLVFVDNDNYMSVDGATEGTPSTRVPNYTTYLAKDKTYRGPAGGIGVSDYPAIPRIVNKTIDSNTDSEGKLNISITVKAEQ